jgi:phosphate transport system permease protein
MSNDTLAVPRLATPVPRTHNLQRPRARDIRERLIETPLFLAALVSILTTAGIVAVLAFETYEFFTVVPL